MLERFLNHHIIDFMRYRKVASLISLVMLIVAIFSMTTRSLNLGLDFTGGLLLEVEHAAPVQLAPIRAALDAAEFDQYTVQHFGSANSVLVRVRAENIDTAKQMTAAILQVLKSVNDNAALKREEFVGPQVGTELSEQGLLALFVALGCIMIYVTVRFEWKFALGSVAALAHDVIITLGFFSLFQIEFDLTVLAALLAVIGYSLNDTIVVYDRMRENFRAHKQSMPIPTINQSLSQMLSRTMITSLTTLLVLLALYVYGGAFINGFAFALIIGVLVGTYSSIYVASSLALWLGVKREDLMPLEIEKEGADL